MPNSEVFVCEALQAMKNWCVWKLELRKGKQTKVPYDICTGKNAKSNDRSTWREYRTVSELLKTNCARYNGLGFMISDGIVFIDIDHCIADDGSINEIGRDVLSAFPLSYAEISQSGHGIHILTRGVIPCSFKRNSVEMYAEKRYCAYTGDRIRGDGPILEQDGIDYVFNKYSGKANQSQKTRSSPVSTSGIFSATSSGNHSDRWIIEHAKTARNGPKFIDLFFAGNIAAYDNDESRADEALCNILAFWTDRDPVQIDRLFRRSALYRPKWERKDYRTWTIEKACRFTDVSLSELQSAQQDSRLEMLKNASAEQVFSGWGCGTDER